MAASSSSVGTKRKGDPYSTGNGGGIFEHRFQAYMLLCMALDLPIPTFTSTTVIGSLIFQADTHTDDMLVRYTDERGRNGRLLCQVKHELKFKNSGQYKSAIGGAWKDFKSADFDTGTDRIFLVTGMTHAETAVDARRLYSLCRKHRQHSELEPLLDAKSAAFKKLFERHVDIVKAVDPSADEQKTLEFLACVYLLQYDFDYADHSKDLALAQSTLKMALVENGELDEYAIWNYLFDLAGEYNQHGKTVSSITSDLPFQVLQSLRPWQQASKEYGEEFLDADAFKAVELSAEEDWFEIPSRYRADRKIAFRHNLSYCIEGPVYINELPVPLTGDDLKLVSSLAKNDSVSVGNPPDTFTLTLHFNGMPVYCVTVLAYGNQILPMPKQRVNRHVFYALDSRLVSLFQMFTHVRGQDIGEVNHRQMTAIEEVIFSPELLNCYVEPTVSFDMPLVQSMLEECDLDVLKRFITFAKQVNDEGWYNYIFIEAGLPSDSNQLGTAVNLCINNGFIEGAILLLELYGEDLDLNRYTYSSEELKGLTPIMMMIFELQKAKSPDELNRCGYLYKLLLNNGTDVSMTMVNKSYNLIFMFYDCFFLHRITSLKEEAGSEFIQQLLDLLKRFQGNIVPFPVDKEFALLDSPNFAAKTFTVVARLLCLTMQADYDPEPDWAPNLINEVIGIEIEVDEQATSGIECFSRVASLLNCSDDEGSSSGSSIEHVIGVNPTDLPAVTYRINILNSLIGDLQAVLDGKYGVDEALNQENEKKAAESVRKRGRDDSVLIARPGTLSLASTSAGASSSSSSSSTGEPNAKRHKGLGQSPS